MWGFVDKVQLSGRKHSHKHVLRWCCGGESRLPLCLSLSRCRVEPGPRDRYTVAQEPTPRPRSCGDGTRPPAAATTDRIAAPAAVVVRLRALHGSTTADGGCTVLLAEPPRSGDALWYCQRWRRRRGGVEPARVRPRRWRRRRERPHHVLQLRPRVLPGQVLYYMHSSTECGVIDLSSAAGPPALTTVPVEATLLRSAEAATLSTVEIDGELYTMAPTSTPADVGVYRMDFGRRERVRVESIGDRPVHAVGQQPKLGGRTPTAWPNRLHVFDRKKFYAHRAHRALGSHPSWHLAIGSDACSSRAARAPLPRVRLGSALHLDPV